MDELTIGFIFILVVILISRILNVKANKMLDQEKKAELIDLFSKHQIYTLGILIVIISGYFIALKFNLLNPQVINIIYLILVFGFIIMSGALSFRKLKNNGFPDSYVKLNLAATSIRFFGLMIFFIIIKF
jgi:hypothetical protein